MQLNCVCLIKAICQGLFNYQLNEESSPIARIILSSQNNYRILFYFLFCINSRRSLLFTLDWLKYSVIKVKGSEVQLLLIHI